MSDILTRLQALGVTKGMPEKPKFEPKKPSEQMDALLKTFPTGLVVENDYGYAFINRLRQPLSEPHGEVDMTATLQPSSLFDSMLEIPVSRKEDTLAFDTETSGLSNGSGSFIFMLGLGYFERDEYIVDQLILPDLCAEEAFLRQAELIFSRYPILLSYNGKSFDIPMLQSRLRFHMLPDFTKEIQHIDLLKIPALLETGTRGCPAFQHRTVCSEAAARRRGSPGLSGTGTFPRFSARWGRLAYRRCRLS